MNKIVLIITLGVIGFLSLFSCKSEKIDKKNPLSTQNQWPFEPLSKEVQTNFFNKKLSSNVLVDTGYWTWCNSVMQWKDGKYHAYYSRWKYELGFAAWLTDCEIAHAVADKPEGPYQFVNVVLDNRNKAGWELATAHNPNICVANGKLNLYYISTDLKSTYKENEAEKPLSKWLEDNRVLARNSQRIGLAVASNPSGPFERMPKAIVEPTEGIFKTVAVNPTVTFAEGRFTMIMKGDDVKRNEVFRIQLAGHAKNAEGPFEFEKTPVYDKDQTEDATIWYDKLEERFYTVCHVLGKPELIVLTSKDSYKWDAAENPSFIKKEIVLSNGEIWKPERIERPFVLTDEKGQPVMLFLAVKDKGVSGNIAIPMKKNKK